MIHLQKYETVFNEKKVKIEEEINNDINGAENKNCIKGSRLLKGTVPGLERPYGGQSEHGYVIAFTPWLDMELTGETLESNAATDALITVRLLQGMISMFTGDDSTKVRNPLANPLHADFNGYPPLYINAGGAEMLLDDARRLYDRATNVGVQATLSVVDGMQHVFPFLAGRAPEVDEEIQKIAAWYRALQK